MRRVVGRGSGYSSASFNPRIPCGMRHALVKASLDSLAFQSTHPMRDATPFSPHNHCISGVSIHASHAGCDVGDGVDGGGVNSFNPRIPCGMRQSRIAERCTQRKVSIHASHAGCDCVGSFSNRFRIQFQSTHPMRDATFPRRQRRAYAKSFQSTHPMRDATCSISLILDSASCFNPRIPCGMRLPR